MRYSSSIIAAKKPKSEIDMNVKTPVAVNRRIELKTIGRTLFSQAPSVTHDTRST